VKGLLPRRRRLCMKPAGFRSCAQLGLWLLCACLGAHRGQLYQCALLRIATLARRPGSSTTRTCSVVRSCVDRERMSHKRQLDAQNNKRPMVSSDELSWPRAGLDKLNPRPQEKRINYTCSTEGISANGTPLHLSQTVCWVHNLETLRNSTPLPVNNIYIPTKGSFKELAGARHRDREGRSCFSLLLFGRSQWAIGLHCFT